MAEEAGYAPGLLHHHFQSKQDLLESLATELIQRVREAGTQVFVSVLEPHGEYNGSREFTTASASSVAPASASAMTA